MKLINLFQKLRFISSSGSQVWSSWWGSTSTWVRAMFPPIIFHLSVGVSMLPRFAWIQHRTKHHTM